MIGNFIFWIKKLNNDKLKYTYNLKNVRVSHAIFFYVRAKKLATKQYVLVNWPTSMNVSN